MRMSHEEFLHIQRIIDKEITLNQVLGEHKVIWSKTRLIVTVRYLAIGETCGSLNVQSGYRRELFVIL